MKLLDSDFAQSRAHDNINKIDNGKDGCPSICQKFVGLIETLGEGFHSEDPDGSSAESRPKMKVVVWNVLPL